MPDIWVTSDTHFNHANILKFDRARGDDFSSVEEMNETIVDRWNSVVKKGDKVYHLGDVFFGPKADFQALWPRLNGSKRLVVGNHDDIKWLSAGGFFKKVFMWRSLKNFGLVLTHVPMESSCIDRVGTSGINVHGHIHRKPTPTERHLCVCVEQTDYTPVNIEELRVR